MSRHRETRSRQRIHVALDERTLDYLTSFRTRASGQSIAAGEVIEALVATIAGRPELTPDANWICDMQQRDGGEATGDSSRNSPVVGEAAYQSLPSFSGQSSRESGRDRSAAPLLHGSKV